jgi:hypothetical protein
MRAKGCSLRQPNGRVHFAGDYMTDMSAWMQGAFESARDVAAALHRRALTGPEAARLRGFAGTARLAEPKLVQRS